MDLMDFLFPKKKMITIDIGARFIKAAHFVVNNKQPILSHFAMLPTPLDTFQRGVIVEQHAISKVVESIIKSINWRVDKKTALSLSGICALTTKMDIPKSEKEVIKENIKFKASQYLPYELSECSYQYIPISGVAKDPNMQSYFFVAANKNSVYTYSSIMRNMSVKTAFMSPDFFSLQRTFAANMISEKSSDKTVLLLDVGFQKTGFHVLYENQLIFSRSFPVGTQSYTHALESGLGISYKEANHIVDSISKGEVIPSEAVSIIKSNNIVFCKEIAMGVEYFCNYFPDYQITQCYVMGGGQAMPGIQSEITKQLKMPTKDFPLFRKLQTKGFSKKKLVSIQPFANICIGLAMGLLEES